MKGGDGNEANKTQRPFNTNKKNQRHSKSK